MKRGNKGQQKRVKLRKRGWIHLQPESTQRAKNLTENWNLTDNKKYG